LAPGRTPFYVNTEKRPWLPSPDHPRRAAVSSFGFGGSNFHCVLEEHQPRKAAIDWDGDVQILAFSAQREEELAAQLDAWPAGLAWDGLRVKAALARGTFSAEHACRLVLVAVKDKTDPGKLLASARNQLDHVVEKAAWSSPEGLYFSRGRPAGKLGVLFPGQGAQYVGMLRD